MWTSIFSFSRAPVSPSPLDQGRQGWDIAVALNHIRARDTKSAPASARAAKAVLDRLAKVPERGGG